MFCQKERNFVLTKFKQKISNTKEETKKMKTTPFVLSIKFNNNVNDLNKNVTNFFLILYSITSQSKQLRILFCFDS